MRSSVLLMATALLPVPGGGSSFIPAPIYSVTSLAFDGTYLWAANKDGYGTEGSNHLISKIDRSVETPWVVATVDVSDYADGGLGGSGDVNIRQIRSDGVHVFAGILSSYDSVGDTHSGFLVIIDKSTDAIVGHCRFTGSTTGNSAYRPYNPRGIATDGAGNVYVVQTPGSGEASVDNPTIVHKFVVADVIAAYPTYGTPVFSTALTGNYAENIDYGGGYLWVTRGNNGPSALSRVDASTGAETYYAFAAPYAARKSWAVKYAFGSVWVGAATGAAVSNPVLRFDPATFPSAPVSTITTPNSMHTSGGFAIDADDSCLWIGGYQSAGHVWRYSVSPIGSEALDRDATIASSGRTRDLAFDGVNMWSCLYSNKIARLPSSGEGPQPADYYLEAGGPIIPHIPIVTGMSPSNGPAAGGTLVYVACDYTVGATGASVGGLSLTGFYIASATYVAGYTQAHAAGAVNVTVTNPLGTSAPLVAGFTYDAPPAPTVPIVSSISPNHGAAAGGTTVMITVDSSTGATAASVGGVALTSFAIVNATTVSGVTDVHAAGATDVVVTNAVGDSAPLTGAFLYRDPIVPPDLSALVLAMRFAAGSTLDDADVTSYNAPGYIYPASPAYKGYVWQGTVSAGTSEHLLAGNWYDVVPYGGYSPPLHLGSLGGLNTVKRLTGDSITIVYRRDGTVSPYIMTVAYGTYEGFIWVMLKTPTYIDPTFEDTYNHQAVLGGSGNTPEIEIGPDGSGGHVARFRLPSYINGYTTTDFDYYPVTTPITLDGSWIVVMARYSGTTKEIRVNGNPWAVGATNNLSHTQDGSSIYIPGAAPYGTEIADIGSQQLSATNDYADEVYEALRALYPSAGLPAIVL